VACQRVRRGWRGGAENLGRLRLARRRLVRNRLKPRGQFDERGHEQRRPACGDVVAHHPGGTGQKERDEVQPGLHAPRSHREEKAEERGGEDAHAKNDKQPQHVG
jgi:hypothetical protein